MKKLKRYDLPDDIKMRLHNSVLMFNGKPYFAKINAKIQLALWTLSGIEQGANPEYPDVSPEDPGLSLSTPTLGYCNNTHDGHAYYLSRGTFRRQKQGLDQDGIIQSREDLKMMMPGNHLTLAWTLVEKTLINEYPTLENAVKFLKGSKHAVSHAFHRKLCLIKTNDPDIFQLAWATRRIGLYCASRNTATLSRDFAQMGLVNKCHGMMQIRVAAPLEPEDVNAEV